MKLLKRLKLTDKVLTDLKGNRVQVKRAWPTIELERQGYRTKTGAIYKQAPPEANAYIEGKIKSENNTKSSYQLTYKTVVQYYELKKNSERSQLEKEILEYLSQ